jgi:predicted MFS family arabinose efflux permease
LLLVTRGASLILTAGLAYLIWSGRVQVWHVFAFATIQGSIAAFDMPTTQALVPTLVRPAAIGSAIALMAASFNGTRIIGPSIAGVLVAQIGIAGCYAIAAATAIPVLGALLTIRPLTSVTRYGGPVLDSIREGFEYIRHDRLRVTVLGMFLVNSLFGMAYATLMPVVARDVLRAGPEGFGLIMGASGFGSLVGAMTVATLPGLRRKGLAALVCSVLFGLALIAFSQADTLNLALILMAVVGLFNSAYAVLLSTILQTDLDDRYRGRVMSIFTLVVNTMPLAGLQAGAVASAFGAPLALGLSGAVVAVAGAIALVRAPWLRRA